MLQVTIFFFDISGCKPILVLGLEWNSLPPLPQSSHARGCFIDSGGWVEGPVTHCFLLVRKACIHSIISELIS